MGILSIAISLSLSLSLPCILRAFGEEIIRWTNLEETSYKKAVAWVTKAFIVGKAVREKSIRELYHLLMLPFGGTLSKCSGSSAGVGMQFEKRP